MDLTLISKVKLEAPVRNRFRKSITKVTETKDKNISNASWCDLTKSEWFSVRIDIKNLNNSMND